MAMQHHPEGRLMYLRYCKNIYIYIPWRIRNFIISVETNLVQSRAIGKDFLCSMLAGYVSNMVDHPAKPPVRTKQRLTRLL